MRRLIITNKPIIIMYVCISFDDEFNKKNTNLSVLKVEAEGERLWRNCHAQEVLDPEIR